jgi:hypothetical protein
MTHPQTDEDTKRKDKETAKKPQDPPRDVTARPVDEQGTAPAPKTRRPKSGQAI